MNESFLKVREPDVTSEDFKREILVIDLKTGHYHSLRGSAAYVWRLLQQGHSVEKSLPWLAGIYGMDLATIEPGVRTFIADLEKQELLISGTPPIVPPPLEPGQPAGEPYEAPVMESYTDLQDLLLLDPIHEVAPMGWPHKRVDEV
jgi:hypothetical protein